MKLSTEQIAQYTPVIDGILKESDLLTISAKKIRHQLRDIVGHDISEQKDEITELIGERFDFIRQLDSSTTAAAPPPKPAANGHSNGMVKAKPKKEVKADSPFSSLGTATPSVADADDSDVDISPPKKKQRNNTYTDSDAKLAAMLQAEENSRSRPTRGGVNKKAVAMRKKPSTKKKSATKIKADDDSDMDLNSDGEKKDVVRKGGFHKEYVLSEPLADLVGAPQLSRPQVVKKIWDYIKERDLQDPNDKRQIICVDKLYSVFKTDKIHMFTMNKVLGKHLYSVEETVA